MWRIGRWRNLSRFGLFGVWERRGGGKGSVYKMQQFSRRFSLEGRDFMEFLGFLKISFDSLPPRFENQLAHIEEGDVVGR